MQLHVQHNIVKPTHALTTPLLFSSHYTCGGAQLLVNENWLLAYSEHAFPVDYWLLILRKLWPEGCLLLKLFQ